MGKPEENLVSEGSKLIEERRNEPSKPLDECCGGQCGCQETPSDVGTGQLNLHKEIVLGDLKPNSLLLLKVDGQINKLTIDLIHLIQERYGQLLKDKGITVAVVDNFTEIESLDESMMNSLGWHKKGKILVP